MSAARKINNLETMSDILARIGYTVKKKDQQVNPQNGRYVVDLGSHVSFFSKNKVLLGTLSYKSIRELV